MNSTAYTGPKTAGGDVCNAVFVVQAAKCGRGLQIGKSRLSAEDIQKAASQAEAMIDAALRAGTTTEKDIAQCVELYEIQYGSCASIPAAPPALPPAAPPISSGGGGSGGGGGGGLFIPEVLPGGGGGSGGAGGGAGGDETTAQKKGLSIWWLVAIIGGGLLIKKLAQTKVIGAAVAGVPLIAGMDEDDDDENEQAEEAEKDED
jgi:hypothetical protein